MKKYIIIILYLFASLIAKAQTDTLVCNTNLTSYLTTGNLVKSARDVVTLSAGFSLNNTLGYTFTANTDHTIVPNTPDYLTPSQVVTGASRTLDKTNCVPGSIGGSINVGPSGAASYSLPIQVSPGSHGMQPNLGIGYSSQSDNDILGYSWHLSGLSAITRIEQNQYYDNTIAPVTLTATDKYSLDGQRLISTGTNTYAPENNPYTKVVFDGTKFTVTTQDGLITEYGGTSDSRFFIDSGNFPFSYAINKITDTEGNYMLYTYIGNNTTGEYRINEIKYTGNGSTAPYNTVNFYYQNRTDINTSYVAGHALNQTLLLTSVKVFAEGSLAYDYGFTYFNDGLYSKLNQIAFIANGTKFNPTIVNWGSLPDYSTTIKDNGTSFGSIYNHQLYFGDLNGDGKTDIITKSNKKPIIGGSLSNGGGNYTSAGGFSYSNFSNFSDIQIVDWNSDGKDDIIVHLVDSLNSKDKVIAYTLNGSSFSVLAEIDYSINPISDKYKYFYSDFDNNGKMDRLVVKNGTLTACDSLGITTIPSITGIDDIKLIDFDGDGQTEILTIDTSGNGSIWKYNGTTFVKIYNSTFFGKSANLFTGDFNGDGKTDYVSYNGSSWGIYYSTGTGFVSGTMPSGFKSYEPAQTGQLDLSKTLWYNSYDCNDILTQVPLAAIYKPATTVYIDDLNNDGNADIIYTYNDTISVFISNGNSFMQVSNFKISNATAQNAIYLKAADLNGNNQKEIIYGNDDNPYGASALIVDCPRGGEYPYPRQITEYVVTPGTALHENYKTISFNSSLDTALYANSITNGNNITTTINYSSVYTNTSGIRKYPVIPIVNPLHLAVNITSTDLNTQQVLSNVNYTFQNGYIHQQGLGFLGFTTVTSSNTLSKDSSSTIFNNTITDYTGHTCYFTWPNKQSSYSHGVNASLVTNTMKARGGNLTNKFFVPVTVSSLVNDYIKGYTTTNSIVAFDSIMGMVTSQKTIVSGTGSGNWTVLSNPTYQQITGTNKSKLLQVISSRTNANGTFTDTVSYTYANTSYPLRVTKVTSPGAKGIITSDMGSDNTTFDSFGNNIKTTVSVTDGTPSRSSSFTYDNYGRFVISSKDVTGFISYAAYRAIDGAVLSKTNPNGLSVNYDYSSGGNSIVSTVSMPDGNVSTQTLAWDNSISGSLCKTVKNVSNGNTVTDYYNALGQKLKETAVGFNSTPMSATWTYMRDGRDSTTADNAGNVTIYTYLDSYAGRLYKVKGLNTDIQYDYYASPYKVKVKDNISGIAKTQTMDAAGNVTSALTTPLSGTATQVDYIYKPSGNVWKISNTADAGITPVTMDYDKAGNQILLTDPDAGTIKYRYNGFSQLISQHDALNQVDTVIYDTYGRLLTKKATDKIGVVNTTSYTYSSTKGSLGLLQSVSRDNVTESYTYDGLGRAKTVTATGNVNAVTSSSTNFVTTFSYNSIGQVSSIAYPTGLSVNYQYDAIGNLKEIDNAAGGAAIWIGKSVNTLNQWSQYTLNNNTITTNFGYDAKYRLNSISATAGSTNIMNLGYTYNTANQLTQRKDNVFSLTEGFRYDGLDCLTCDSLLSSTVVRHVSSYLNNGNINNTSWTGNYNYTNTAHPHAVTQVLAASTALLPAQKRDTFTTTTYNADNKILTIDNLIYKNSFTYGVSGNRFRVDFYKNSSLTSSKVYIGSNEFGYNNQTSPSNIYKRTIIYAPTGACAVYQDSAGIKNIYYIHTDNQGSWLAITDGTGSLKNRYSYDAWGRPRDPATWKIDSTGTSNVLTNLNAMQPRFDRGYTGHEMICGFGLINMNGRVYDPYLQRFLSPDNVVQAPDNTQSYNRYSYCLNNPLRYTDPNGYVHLPGNRKVANLPATHPVVSHPKPTNDLSNLDCKFLKMPYLENYFVGAQSLGSRMGGGYGFSSGMSVVDAFNYLTSSGCTYGGTWTNGSITEFTSDQQAFDAGSAYNDYHNSWGNTAYGSKQASYIAFYGLTHGASQINIYKSQGSSSNPITNPIYNYQGVKGLTVNNYYANENHPGMMVIDISYEAPLGVLGAKWTQYLTISFDNTSRTDWDNGSWGEFGNKRNNSIYYYNDPQEALAYESAGNLYCFGDVPVQSQDRSFEAQLSLRIPNVGNILTLSWGYQTTSLNLYPLTVLYHKY